MTGKLYYITTIGGWKRYAEALANSHWVVLEPAPADGSGGADCLGGNCGDLADSTKIVVLAEADEGMHGALEDDPAFEPLPHPLSQKPIADSARRALAVHGVIQEVSTFDAAEMLGQVHPLLKVRVF
jgi:hypothetical protein